MHVGTAAGMRLERAAPSANLLAAQALMQVVDEQQSLAAVLPPIFEQLPAAQHSYMQAQVYGACRQYCYLAALLTGVLKKPLKKRYRLLHHLLVQSLYQLEYMRTPPHAVVNNSVATARAQWPEWAANLVNAVLRNFIRERAHLGQALDAAARHALPQHIYQWIARDWPEQCAAILRATNEQPPMTLRVNLRATTRAAYLARLAAHGIAAEVTADSARGVTLHHPVAVGELPGFAEGAASVQDEAAQLVLEALEVAASHTVLDACAAPGGKTGLILEAAVLPARLLATDLAARLPRLRDNLRRLPPVAAVELEIRAADLLGPAAPFGATRFERILLDLPCSGSGVIRRHPDIKHRRRAQDLPRFAAQQLAMLEKAWALLAAGGKLLYVTCSILRQENDQVIDRFVHGQADAQVECLPQQLGIATQYGRQRLPGVHSGDGFYYCRLGKS